MAVWQQFIFLMDLIVFIHSWSVNGRYRFSEGFIGYKHLFIKIERDEVTGTKEVYSFENFDMFSNIEKYEIRKHFTEITFIR